jgi:hypothetical protein
MNHRFIYFVGTEMYEEIFFNMRKMLTTLPP